MVLLKFVDWEYLTEGGHHVVLRYRGDEERFKGSVLRIEKVMPSLNKLSSGHISESKYLVSVMEPLLSSTYMYHPQAMKIDTSFVRQLNQVMKSDTNRTRNELVEEDCCEAYLFPDVTHISSNLPQFTNSKQNDQGGLSPERDIQISIEIKVKNGFKSTSPFVKNRIKHACSRYQLNQYAKKYRSLKNNIGMNYGGNFPGISSYDPADICSRDRSRVFHSLQCLLQNPQNNLKISSNGQHIFGLNLLEDKKLVEGCLQLLTTVPKFNVNPEATISSNTIESSSSSSPIDTLIQLVTEILCVESALERLRHVQSADILDVEGIAHVFEVFCRHVSATELRDHPHQQQQASQCSSVVNCALDLISRSLEEAASPHQQLQQIWQLSSRELQDSQQQDGKDIGVSHSPHSAPLVTSSAGGLHLAKMSTAAIAPTTSSRKCPFNEKLLCTPHMCEATTTSTSLGEEQKDRMPSSTTNPDCNCLHHRLRRYQVSETTSEEELSALKSKCALEIAALSMSDCLELLKVWLISLAASDASLVVTLKADHSNHVCTSHTDLIQLPSPLQDNEAKSECGHNGKQTLKCPESFITMSSIRNDRCETKKDNRANIHSKSHEYHSNCDYICSVQPRSNFKSNNLISVCCPQTTTTTRGVEVKGGRGVGSVSITCPRTGVAQYYLYQVTFIDLGPKPVGKIVDKIKKEEFLCFQAESVYRQTDY